MIKKILKKSFIDSFPIMIGYLILGMGFGIMLAEIGYGPGWAAFTSLIDYAGAMEYALVGLIGSGASLLTVAFTTLAVNFRHIFYGVSMIERYRGIGPMKPYLAFAMTDETYSLVSNDLTLDALTPTEKKWYCSLVSVFDHCYWIAGSALGAWIGNTVTFSLKGVGFSLTALFVTIFTEQWVKNKKYAPALIGLFATLFCLIVFKHLLAMEDFLIPATILITALLFAFKKPIEGGNGNV